MLFKDKKEIIGTLLRAKRPGLANAVAKKAGITAASNEAEALKVVAQALAPYGASLTEDKRIQRNGKVLGVSVVIKGGKLRFVSTAGNLLFSGPVAPQAVEKFVESFWFWKRSGITAAAKPPEVEDMITSIRDDVEDIRGKVTKVETKPGPSAYRIDATIQGYAPKGPGGPHGITYRAPTLHLILDYFIAGPKTGTWVIQGTESNAGGKPFKMKDLWHVDTQKAVNHVTKLLKEHGTNYVQYD